MSLFTLLAPGPPWRRRAPQVQHRDRQVELGPDQGLHVILRPHLRRRLPGHHHLRQRVRRAGQALGTIWRNANVVSLPFSETKRVDIDVIWSVQNISLPQTVLLPKCQKDLSIFYSYFHIKTLWNPATDILKKKFVLVSKKVAIIFFLLLANPRGLPSEAWGVLAAPHHQVRIFLSQFFRTMVYHIHLMKKSGSWSGAAPLAATSRDMSYTCTGCGRPWVDKTYFIFLKKSFNLILFFPSRGKFVFFRPLRLPCFVRSVTTP